jgi:hypothetical protein
MRNYLLNGIHERENDYEGVITSFESVQRRWRVIYASGAPNCLVLQTYWEKQGEWQNYCETQDAAKLRQHCEWFFPPSDPTLLDPICLKTDNGDYVECHH